MISRRNKLDLDKRNEIRVCSINYMGPTTLPKVVSVFITELERK